MMLAVWNWRIGASPLIKLGMLKVNLSARTTTLNKRSSLTYAFFKIDENHVGQHLKAIPPSVDYNLRSVPKLGAVTHPRLGELQFIDFWLIPVVFLSVKNEDIVHYALLSVTLAASEHN
jgi:hypothetical protein